MSTKASIVEFLLSTNDGFEGGTVTFFSAGTSNAKTIWLDRNKATPAANPYTLDTSGCAQLYADGLYRIVIKNSSGVTVYTRDYVGFGLQDGPWIDVADYASLTAAIAAIGATETDLLVDSDTTLTAHTTVPANIRLVSTIKGGINLGAYNLTLNRTPSLADSTLFTGTGYLIFGSGICPTVNAAWWGAKGDNLTGSRAANVAAFQAAADSIAQSQLTANAPVSKNIVAGVMEIPQGQYLLDDRIKFHGFYVIRGGGGGGGLSPGTTIIQTVNSKNIFEFYGYLGDNYSGGFTVENINFGFDTSTTAGIALYVPQYDDNAPAQELSVNSLYIRNNRFGTYHPDGAFIQIDHANDVEISSNLIDTCTAAYAVQLGVSGKVTDVRHFGNGYYGLSGYGLYMTGVGSLASTGNNYFGGAANTAYAIYMTGDSTNDVESVTVTGDTFENLATIGINADYATGINISHNVFRKVNDYPVIISGTGPLKNIQIRDNDFNLEMTTPSAPNYNFAQTKLISVPTAGAFAGVLTGNIVDARTNTSLVSFLTAGGMGVGATVFGNRTHNSGTAYNSGQFDTYMLNSRDLVFEHEQIDATAYPTAANVLNFGTLAQYDSATFDLNYTVVVDKTGVGASIVTGLMKVSIASATGSGTPAHTITDVSKVSDGTGPATVAFDISGTGPTYLTITVADGGLTAPVEVISKYRISNVVARGTITATPVQW